MPTAKQQLRNRLREQRRALSCAYVADRSQRISRHLIAAPIFQRARTIILYSSTDKEVNTEAIWHEARRQDKRVYYPCLTSDRGEIEFVLRDDRQPLVPGVFGILVPPGNEILQWVAATDVVLSPGVGFDPAGHRLGRGRGYYDRAFRGVLSEAIRVGLAYDFQVVSDIPADDGDETVDYLVTETGCLMCSPQSAAPPST